MKKQSIRIGGASGYWGDAALATPQLLTDYSITGKKLDYLVYDYLAEITMSIMARARAADETQGFASDFVYSVLKNNLQEISNHDVKVIANAGGVNPQACASAIQSLIKDLGLNLKVGVVLGDDLLTHKEFFAKNKTTEMFSDDEFPNTDSIVSINAYLGAFPIAAALHAGADIVVTGRCVDSAVTLAACIYEFNWNENHLDLLAQGSLAGHILECGTQVTGGNFTDWESVADTLHNVGYPIAEISRDGTFTCTKVANTGGVVSYGTVVEQMLYEIGNPQAYILPDVVCDFSHVEIIELKNNLVQVKGALGNGMPSNYKASATYADGYRSGHVLTFYGRAANIKAQKFSENVLKRCREILELKGLGDFSETLVEIIGSNSQYGLNLNVNEVDVKIAVKHTESIGIKVFLKELTGLYLSGPPGLTGFAGTRPKPSPVVRLFSMLVPKQQVDVKVFVDGLEQVFDNKIAPHFHAEQNLHVAPKADYSGETIKVSLEQLAWGRSGDKGDHANIGIIARKAEFLPFIVNQITSEKVVIVFKHFLSEEQKVESFYLPGVNAINFLLYNVLGGGGMTSLRSDPQGKGYAQILLEQEIEIPAALLS